MNYPGLLVSCKDAYIPVCTHLYTQVMQSLIHTGDAITHTATATVTATATTAYEYPPFQQATLVAR